MATKITLKEAVKLLNNHKKNNKENTIFKVIFIKRTTGKRRVMRARYNVVSHLKGGELKFSPDEKHLSIAFDMDKREYRSINLEMIKKLRICGKSYIVTNGQLKTVNKTPKGQEEVMAEEATKEETKAETKAEGGEKKEKKEKKPKEVKLVHVKSAKANRTSPIDPRTGTRFSPESARQLAFDIVLKGFKEKKTVKEIRDILANTKKENGADFSLDIGYLNFVVASHPEMFEVYDDGSVKLLTEPKIDLEAAKKFDEERNAKKKKAEDDREKRKKDAAEGKKDKDTKAEKTEDHPKKDKSGDKPSKKEDKKD